MRLFAPEWAALPERLFPFYESTQEVKLENRADLHFSWTAVCGELQTPVKPRTVDRVSGGQFVRSLPRSRVHAGSRARGARQASSERVNRQPGAKWALRANSLRAARQAAAAWSTPMAPPDGTNALGTSARAGVPPGRWCKSLVAR